MKARILTLVILSIIVLQVMPASAHIPSYNPYGEFSYYNIYYPDKLIAINKEAVFSKNKKFVAKRLQINLRNFAQYYPLPDSINEIAPFQNNHPFPICKILSLYHHQKILL